MFLGAIGIAGTQTVQAQSNGEQITDRIELVRDLERERPAMIFNVRGTHSIVRYYDKLKTNTCSGNQVWFEAYDANYFRDDAPPPGIT